MSAYKLVPVEPTPDMLAAGHYAIEAGCHPSGIYADMLAAAPAAHGPQFLSDEKILEIASNPMVTPCSPWWLKNDVKAGDVQNSAIAFARAVLKAAAPDVQGEPVAWYLPSEAGYDSCFRDHATIQACTANPWTGWLPLYLHPQPAEQHPDDDAVDRFAAAVKAKLNKKRQEGRWGWRYMTAEQLSALLHEHVCKCDPVDVANLAMMLHQNGQRIEQRSAPDVTQLVEALEDINQWTSRWVSADHPVAKAARKALAAYNKQGEE